MLDVRDPFHYDQEIERARIFDLKQPFEKQSHSQEYGLSLYDGFELQRIFAKNLPETDAEHLHLILTDLMTCTFSEDDLRYHGRTVICGSPSIISTTGIIEAPAKPRAFYLAQIGGIDSERVKKEFSGKFLDYGDDRLVDAAAIYAIQALFFFVSCGELFCKNKNCILYNPHWQLELVHLVEKGDLCTRHRTIADKFNMKLANRLKIWKARHTRTSFT